MRRILAGIVVAVMMAGGAVAEPGAVLSSGAKPCGDFVAAPLQDKWRYEAWAVGYVSGQNSMDVGSMRDVGSSWTPDSVMVWLQNYCSQHPLEDFAAAADKLRQELAAQEGRLPQKPSALDHAGDAEKGKADFAKPTACGLCHQVGPGAKNLIGPELNGIVGRKAASVADYALYSAGMKKLAEEGWVWTEENIDKWITNPKAMIPDSPMALAFQGIPDAAERADIIAYLKTNQ
jgi:cytochrome c